MTSGHARSGIVSQTMVPTKFKKLAEETPLSIFHRRESPGGIGWKFGSDFKKTIIDHSVADHPFVIDSLHWHAGPGVVTEKHH